MSEISDEQMKKLYNQYIKSLGKRGSVQRLGKLAEYIDVSDLIDGQSAPITEKILKDEFQLLKIYRKKYGPLRPVTHGNTGGYYGYF